MYNKSICKTTRLYFSRKICEKFKKIERDLDTFKTFHSRVEHVHLKPFEEFFFVKKLVRLFSKRIKLHINYLSKQIHFLSHQLFNLYLHNSKYFVIALSFFSFLFSFNFNKILSLSFFHHYFSNNNQKTSSIETVHDEYTNEFPQTIRHSLVERAHACIRVEQEDKEVVVNALTLICQEFCRTRTYGETREERQLEELLSHTTLRKACCTRTDTRDVRYTCTRQPDNAFRTVSRIGSTSCQNCLIVCHTNSPEFSSFRFSNSPIGGFRKEEDPKMRIFFSSNY